MKVKTFLLFLILSVLASFFYDPKWDGEKIEELKEQDEKEKIIKEHTKQTKEESKEKKSVTIHLKGTKLKVLDITTSYVGAQGKPLSTKEFLEFLIGKLGEYYDDEAKLREIWSKQESRKNFLKSLENDGVDENVLKNLSEIFDKKDCDIYDVLAHLSFNSEIKTRQERVLQVENGEFLKRFQKEKVIKIYRIFTK